MPTDAGPVDEQSPLNVLVLHRPPASRVRYIDQVVGEGMAGIDLKFGRKTLRRWSADVVHLTRFDALYGDDGPTGPRLVKAVLGVAAQLKRHRIALVRTVHGADRRRRSNRWDRMADWILNRVTTTFVVLDESAPLPSARRTKVIPLGHLRDRFTGYPRSEQTPGRLLFLAPVQLGRTVLAPVEAFPEAELPSLSLLVIGPAGPALARQLSKAAAEHAGITARIEHFSTGSMISEITAAELVILPGVDKLEELTVLTAALSLDRPVLVPDSETARALAEAHGADWIRRYSGKLTGKVLDETLQDLRTTPPHGPHLDGRDLTVTAAEYAEVYQAAAKKRRRPRA